MPTEPGLGAPVERTRAPGTARPPTPAQVAATPRAVAAAEPEPRRRRAERPRRRGRRVRRVVRRVELWSVLKIGIIFNTVMFGIALGAVAVLWGLANTTGLIDDLEGFLRDSGFEDFRFDGDVMFRQVAFIGGVATLAVTVLMVLAAALFNLISEVTGGVRFVVIEEIVERPDTHPTSAAAPAAPTATRPPPRPSLADERLPTEPPTSNGPSRAARAAAAPKPTTSGRNGKAPRRRAAPTTRPEGPASAPAP